MLTGHAALQQSGPKILITGASGELGAALARLYASPGNALLLWGRNERRLEDVADGCLRAGAHAAIRSLDLSDSSAAVAAVEDEDDASPISLAIFASGLGDTQVAGTWAEAAAQVARLGLINFVAPSAMASALAARMAQRGSGQIVLIGSAAAFHALPFAAAYSGSKAGLAQFAEALRLGVAKHGVHVTLVSPGFIDTAAGRRTPGHKPFLMTPAAAAVRIARAADRAKPHLVMPWPFVLLRWIDRLLPRAMRDALLLRLAPPAG